MGILDFLRGNKTPQPAMAQQAPAARPARQGFGFNARTLAYLLSPDAAYEGEQRRFELDQRQEAMDTARQNAEAKRSKAELDARIGATLYGMPQGYGAQNMPATAPEAPQMPAEPQGAPIPQQAPQAPQAPQISPTTGLPMVQEQYTATARVRRPAPPAPEPADMAAAFEDAARQYAGAGFVEDANAAWKQAQELRTQAQTSQTGKYQRAAALLAPALRLQGNAQTDQINFILNDLAQSMGVQLPSEVEDALLDPAVPAQRKQAILSSMVNYAAPEDAAKQAIKTQGTYDEFQPFQRDDNGGNLQIFDPKTGAYTQGPAKTVDPNNALSARVQMRGQDVQAATAAANRASQQRIAAIRASTTMSEGEKNRAVQRERTQTQQRIAILTGKVQLGNEVGADEFADGEDY